MKRQLKIGNVTLENPFILAPMAGVTDLPFRLLCREQGAAMVCSEMVSAKALYYAMRERIKEPEQDSPGRSADIADTGEPGRPANPADTDSPGEDGWVLPPRTPGEILSLLEKRNRNSARLLETDERERPLSLQIFGCEPQIMAEMGHYIEGLPFDILDVNMGCPVPKVVNNGEGSALMEEPCLAEEILRQLVKTVNRPVTVKMRLGVDEAHKNVLELALRAQEAGVAAVAIHGRTRDQLYSGKARWELIGKAADALDIPVLGNGDVFCAEDGVRMMKETGCAGVLVARGARGNPWIFRELVSLYETGTVPPRPDGDAVRDMVLRHARLQCRYMAGGRLPEETAEKYAMREMRKHVAWYTAGMPHSARLRDMSNRIETMEDLAGLLDRAAACR